jgi:hypothetical protein
VIEEARQRSVPVHRVSQGSGIMLHPDAEIAEMCRLGREQSIEVNLFVGPRSTFDVGAQAYTQGGRRSASARGAPTSYASPSWTSSAAWISACAAC